MKTIDYSPEVMNTLGVLSKSFNKMLFKKENDKVVLKMKSNGNLLQFECKLENFDFEGDELALADFGSFFSYYNKFKNPEIIHNGRNLVLKQGTTKINYVTAEPELFKESVFDQFVLEDDFGFTLSAEKMKEINVMVSLLKAKVANVVCKNGKVHILIGDTGIDNSFETEIDNDVYGEGETEFEVSILKDLPIENFNFKYGEPAICLSYKTENYSYSVVVGEAV